jgi:hypothetical protein
VVAAVIVLGPSGSGRARSPAAGSALPAALDRGQIVFREPAGYLALASPGGTYLSPLKGLAGVGVSPSPDGRYLSGPLGQVFAVESGPRLASNSSKVQLSGPSFTLAQPYPFADHDSDLIVLLNQIGSTGQDPVSVHSIASGRALYLGSADAAAGDPQTAGAFVSVPGQPVASSTAAYVSPDTGIELLEARQAPVVLATAAAISSDLGLADQAVHLVPLPDRAGDKIAILVEPAASGGFYGIVVLNRAGQMLGTTGPLQFGDITGLPVWSPSGSSLAYVSLGISSGPGGNTPVLHVWAVGRPPAQMSYASGPGLAKGAGNVLTGGSCIWSPDGTAVLCDSPAHPGQNVWAVARVSPLSVTVIPGPGTPVAWLAGKAGS